MKSYSNQPIRSLGRALHLTIKALGTSVTSNFAAASISLTLDQYIVLKIVYYHETIIQKDVAELMKRDKSSLFRQINQLQERKLIARITDAEDKRRNFLVITKQGSELIDIATEIEAKTVNELLEGVTEDEMKTFNKVLETIQKNSIK